MLWIEPSQEFVGIIFQTAFRIMHTGTCKRVQYPTELGHVGYVVCTLLHNTVHVFMYYRLKAVCEV